MYVVAQNECILLEAPNREVFIRAEAPAASQLGVMLVVYEYFAYAFARYAATAFQRINGTGTVPACRVLRVLSQPGFSLAGGQGHVVLPPSLRVTLTLNACPPQSFGEANGLVTHQRGAPISPVLRPSTGSLISKQLSGIDPLRQANSPPGLACSFG